MKYSKIILINFINREIELLILKSNNSLEIIYKNELHLSWKLNRTIIVILIILKDSQNLERVISITFCKYFSELVSFLLRIMRLFCHCDVKTYSITLDLWPWCHVGYQKSDQPLDMIERVLTLATRYCNKKYTAFKQKSISVLERFGENWCKKFIFVILLVLKSLKLFVVPTIVNFYKYKF